MDLMLDDYILYIEKQRTVMGYGLNSEMALIRTFLQERSGYERDAQFFKKIIFTCLKLF
jgi:hypothetical protein